MGLLGMVRFCSSGSEEVVLHAAGVEFHKLFVGPHHVLCPPWGSVYLDGGRLFGANVVGGGGLFRASRVRHTGGP